MNESRLAFTSGDLRSQGPIKASEPSTPLLVKRLRDAMVKHEGGAGPLSLSGRARLAAFAGGVLPVSEMTDEVDAAIWND